MKRAWLFVVAVLLSGCGNLTPQTVGIKKPSPAGVASVRFTIVPTKSTSSGSRKTSYVSQGTQSAGIVITGPNSASTTSTINCAGFSCSGTLDAPIGTDTFAVTLYDQPNARGTILSAGSATQTIAQDQQNNVLVTFNGVAAKLVTIALSNQNPVAGVASQSTITAAVYDPDGYQIIGPGNYSTPVSLTLTDPSGATALSKSTLVSSGDSVTLTYNGTRKIAAVVKASIGSGPNLSATFEPQNISTEYLVPTVNGRPAELVRGPDGAIWFTETGLNVLSAPGANKIGRIDTSGLITQYSTANRPGKMTVGPDGAIWFTEFVNLASSTSPLLYGRITTQGVVTEYSSPLIVGYFANIALGKDGNLYVTGYPNTSTNQWDMIAISPTTGAVVKTLPFPRSAFQLASSPDGNLYVTTGLGISKIDTTTGTSSAFASGVPGILDYSIASNGDIYYADNNTVGKISAQGAVTPFASPYGRAARIIAAADGSAYFTVGFPTRITHLAPDGSSTSYLLNADQQGSGSVGAISFGSDGNIWVAETDRNKIGIFNPN